MDIKSICVFSDNDQDPCNFLRVLGPMNAIGVQVIKGRDHLNQLEHVVRQADLVLIQRIFPRDFPLYQQVRSLARDYKKPIVFDIDDLLMELPLDHPEKGEHIYTTAQLPMIIAMMDADLVTVSTDMLQKTLKPLNDRITVLPNQLLDSLWSLSEPGRRSSGQKICLGYMGSSSHIPDLQIIEDALLQINEKYGEKIEFYFWGITAPERLQNFSNVFSFEPETYQYDEFARYFQQQRADLFIAPLQDNLFNRCKSGIKYLEYTALGAPGVYSNLSAYSDVIENGKNGFLAKNEQEWVDYLSLLIEDQDFRLNMASLAQEDVRQNWLMSTNAHAWLDTYSKTIEEPLKKTYPVFSDSQPFVEKAVVQSSEMITTFTKNLRELKLENDQKVRLLHEQKTVLGGSLRSINEERAKLDEEISTLSNDAIRLTEANDILLTENEKLKTIKSELEKQAQLDQELIANYDQHINEITGSRAWSAITRYRRMRSGLSDTVDRVKRLKIVKTVKDKLRDSSGDTKLLFDSGLFDPDYYLLQNVDVKNAGVDPSTHFLCHGGLEGRAPSEKFDSSWYLNEYSDVKNAGINPLIHYIKFGRKEGRLPKPNFSEPETPDSSIKPLAKILPSMTPDELFLAPQLVQILMEKLRKSYSISISHDNYLEETGGSQVVIADQQRERLLADESYLHIFPYTRGKGMVQQDGLLYIGLNLDGQFIGNSVIREFVRALRQLGEKRFISLHLHHTMGFSLSSLQRLLDFAEKKAFFWLHDYFSLCPSYNLLRNDVEFCGAPEINSNACEICKYSSERQKQLELFKRLFEQNQLTLIAPSDFVLELWQSRFPVKDVPGEVHSPARLHWLPNHATRFEGGTLKVGFLGYPLDYKGWHEWMVLTEHFRGDGRFKFFHFSTDASSTGNYTRIDTRVSKDNRSAMTDDLQSNQIDVVILWSKVAETFSFTLHEALAAGCFVLTNPFSGNIQAYLKNNPDRGMILENEQALISLFESGEILYRVQKYQKDGKPHARLIFPQDQEWIV